MVESTIFIANSLTEKELCKFPLGTFIQPLRVLKKVL